MHFIDKINRKLIKLFAQLNFKNLLEVKVNRLDDTYCHLYIKTKDYEKKFILSDFECRSLPIQEFDRDISYCRLWKDFLHKIFKDEYRVAYNKYLENKRLEECSKYISLKQSICAKAKNRIRPYAEKLEDLVINESFRYSPEKRKFLIDKYKKIIKEEEYNRSCEIIGMSRYLNSKLDKLSELKIINDLKEKNQDLEK